MFSAAGSETNNVMAITAFKKFLDDLAAFMAKDWPYETRGCSILLVVEHSTEEKEGNFCMKLIDLASVELKEDDYVDEGFLTGIKNLQAIIQELLWFFQDQDDDNWL